ncbi:MAG: serine/threonine protein kinase, partial [Lentisphaeria bacterium]|nr:serine/threonine protein kinase [Lentisphaeria bacterium]
MNKVIKSCASYEIIKELASGGMGSVVKAKLKGAEGFEKVVAIKTLLPGFANDVDFVRRFIFEAKLVANLVHENIVQIYQLNKVDDEYFFVLEFVDGISLYDFVEFHRVLDRKLPRNLAVFIASRAARALAYAHSRHDADGKPLNIVHCDICPHNILINKEGVTKLTDFGIAKAATLKNSSTVSGKLAFMSPEQCNDPEHLTKSSDIYSLGVVLFYMLSDHYSRDIRTDRNSLIEQIRCNYVNYAALPDDLPDELRRILQKMLAADPAERYADCSELARELDYYIYRDGYGPSNVVLSEYMRAIMPGRFGDSPESDGKTEVLPPDYFDHHQ